jgi:hypothetical protein
VSPVSYELGFYIPEDDILHSHRRESLKSYTVKSSSTSRYTRENCDLQLVTVTITVFHGRAHAFASPKSFRSNLLSLGWILLRFWTYTGIY